MKVHEIMHGQVVLNENLSVQFAAKVMRDKNVGSVLVDAPGGAITGIVTERDVLKKVVAAGLNPVLTTLKEIMSNVLITISEDADVTDASSLLWRHHIRRLPVVNGMGKIVGVVSARDIAKSIGFAQAQKIRGDYGRISFFQEQL